MSDKPPTSKMIRRIIEELELDAKRIRSKDTPTVGFLCTEMAGTCLASVKDLAEVVRDQQSALEPLITILNDHADTIDRMQAQLEDMAMADEDSRLLGDDAALLADVCNALVVLAGELAEGRAPALDDDGKAKLRSLVELGQRGVELVKELTLEEQPEQPDAQ